MPDCDVAIIGGGPGGYVAAIRAASGRELNRVPVRPDDIVFGTPYRSGWHIAPGDDPRRAVRA